MAGRARSDEERWAAHRFTCDELSAAVEWRLRRWSEDDLAREAAHLWFVYWRDQPDSFLDWIGCGDDTGDPAAVAAIAARLRPILERDGISVTSDDTQRWARHEFTDEEFSAAADYEGAATHPEDVARQVGEEWFDYWAGAPVLFRDWLADEDEGGGRDPDAAAARTLRRIMAEQAEIEASNPQ